MWTQSWSEPAPAGAPVVLTIGAFDGVHLGHQALLRRVVQDARAAELRAVVLAFDPLPWQALRGGADALSELRDRLACFAALGLDGALVLPFDRQIAALTAAEFVAHLCGMAFLRRLWAGADFALGRDRDGTLPVLRHLGAAHGFEVAQFSEVVQWGGEAVRSSRIRCALKAGALEEANGCLGRPYRLGGRVVAGDRRGRELGFPTANLQAPETRLRPANGVYLCRAHIPQGSYYALVNVGARPTFAARPPSLEAYLLDFAGDLYGATLDLDFLHPLRAEYKFSSAQALAEQIRRDEAAARALIHIWESKSHDLASGTSSGPG